MTEVLNNKIRKVTEEDKKKLTRVSYSKLDVLESCPYKFKLKYIDGNYANATSIALELGTLCHKVLELKGRYKMENRPVDYDYLKEVLENGITEKTEKGEEVILGVNVLRKKYFDIWYVPDNASGMNYEEKINLFLNIVLLGEMEDEDWAVYATEMPFSFIYRYGGTDEDPKEVIVSGFIDRVDVNVDEKKKVVDYKTSKKPYDSKHLPTPLQQVIYGIALYCIENDLPVSYEYSMILLNIRQEACTKGYLNRAIKKLDKLLGNMDEYKNSGEYVPKPTPLCYWCDFHGNSPLADVQFKGLCDYYSLWTPTNKTFENNKEYQENSKTVTKVVGRKLIF